MQKKLTNSTQHLLIDNMQNTIKLYCRQNFLSKFNELKVA